MQLPSGNGLECEPLGGEAALQELDEVCHRVERLGERRELTRLVDDGYERRLALQHGAN